MCIQAGKLADDIIGFIFGTIINHENFIVTI